MLRCAATHEAWPVKGGADVCGAVGLHCSGHACQAHHRLQAVTCASFVHVITAINCMYQLSVSIAYTQNDPEEEKRLLEEQRKAQEAAARTARIEAKAAKARRSLPLPLPPASANTLARASITLFCIKILMPMFCWVSVKIARSYFLHVLSPIRNMTL